MAKLTSGSAEGVLTNPIVSSFALTPHDSNDEAEVCRALYVGTTGNVAVVHPDGTVTTLTAMTAGIWHPVVFKRINSTNTTASNLVGGF